MCIVIVQLHIQSTNLSSLLQSNKLVFRNQSYTINDEFLNFDKQMNSYG